MINLAKPLILHGYSAPKLKILKNVCDESDPRARVGKKYPKLVNYPK
jgi:hypothetical protein